MELLLWLASDMDMGGMDMTGLRMIPAGLGIMTPANAPWRTIEFAFVFVMWVVMMVGMMAPSAAPMILMYARAGRQAATSASTVCPDRLVRRRLFPDLDCVLPRRDLGAVGAGARGVARCQHGKRKPTHSEGSF